MWKLIKIIEIRTLIWGINQTYYIWSKGDAFQITGERLEPVSSGGYTSYEAMMDTKFGNNWNGRIISEQTTGIRTDFFM